MKVPYRIAWLLIFFFGLGYILGFKAGLKNKTNSASTIFPVLTPTPVEYRNCVKGQIEKDFDENFFKEKWFGNFAMSGEWGKLNNDYRLPINWGLDWAGPDDTRPNSGVGSWYFENKNGNFKLRLSRTSISDGEYTDFNFYSYKGNIFAIPIQSFNSVIFGPDKKSIEEFFENVVKNCDRK